MNKIKDLEQFRCPSCNKLILSFELKGSLKLIAKCSRCKKINTLIVLG